jgi:protoporphyrin/coproporphyrin ferrochelatase
MPDGRRRGVVLLQFGGPDSPEAIRPFLRELFDDPEILPYPALLRTPLAWTIARLRTPLVRKHYAHMGGASPIRAWTERQAALLAERLGGEAEVAVAMRAWRPSTAGAVERLLAAGCTDLLALPLYPQYSFTTTRSSMTVLRRELARGVRGAAHGVTLRTVRNWPTHPDYVAATCATVRRALAAFPGQGGAAGDGPDGQRPWPHVLFSAHGLPRRVVERGDPYPDDVRATVAAVVAALAPPEGRWSLSFQSRVGYLEWLRPYTDDEVRRLALAGVRDLLVVPMSFVSDHYETVYEMGQLYRDLALAAGVERYAVAPGLNDEPCLIDALESLARHGFEELAAEPVGAGG